ncbi:hypothetical protein BCR34DRAFT_593912 [Clohesyomyces aquaticus]|uniref:Uncharacterized protein n=1 Tax=Clohesyomyces aquaticus TaxID=1231657 RepID=A0A1Y1YE78_9PLEO|nr:hypothetical protein BCR34DRAFT_593912 [Clohesyomyces aquaticus]
MSGQRQFTTFLEKIHRETLRNLERWPVKDSSQSQIKAGEVFKTIMIHWQELHLRPNNFLDRLAKEEPFKATVDGIGDRYYTALTCEARPFDRQPGSLEYMAWACFFAQELIRHKFTSADDVRKMVFDAASVDWRPGPDNETLEDLWEDAKAELEWRRQQG